MTSPWSAGLASFSLGDMLRERARSYPASEAAVCGDVRLTYPELDDRVDALARGLASLEVGAGDRLLWLGLNCHRLVESMLAAARLGAIICPANWRLSADEIAVLAGDFAPKAVICQPGAFSADVLGACRASTAGAAWILAGADRGDAGHSGGQLGHRYEEILQSGEAPRGEVDDRTPLLAIYTAAFDGRPKAALLSHVGIIMHSLSLALAQQLTSDAVYLNCGPMFHMGTLMSTFATLAVGGKNVLIPRLDPDAVVRAVATEGCSRAFLPGAVLDSVSAAARSAGLSLASLLVDVTQPQLQGLGTPDLSPWGQRPGGYGQTEVTAILTAAALGDPGGTGAHGLPIPVTEVTILDSDGAELPAGEIGEIAARGPTVALGYLGEPAAFAARRSGRWYRTNDAGRREQDGSVTFLGPIGRLIKSGGENVYPAEVEQSARGLAAVADVMVLGVPDERWGHRVAALIVVGDGSDAAVAIQAVDSHWRASLASYKRPREILAVTAIPRQDNGMPDEAAARELFR